VQVNGAACALQDSQPNNGSVLFIYAVPLPALLAAQPNKISVAAEPPVTVEALEIRIAPPTD
jgi:hypothetical protein